MGLSELILLWDLRQAGPGQQIHTPPAPRANIIASQFLFSLAIELRWLGALDDWVLFR